jgi:fatty acid desaturase
MPPASAVVVVVGAAVVVVVGAAVVVVVGAAVVVVVGAAVVVVVCTVVSLDEPASPEESSLPHAPATRAKPRRTPRKRFIS